MIKKIKNFIILIAIVMPLICGVTAFAVVTEDEIEVVAKTPTVQDNVPVAEVPTSNLQQVQEEDATIKDIDEIADEDTFKKPNSNVLIKFFIAIAWVVISSLIIYFSLISYKKLSGKPEFGIDVEENTLETPKNFKEAINLFIKKTRE